MVMESHPKKCLVCANNRIHSGAQRAEGARAEPHSLEKLVNPSSRETLVMTSPYERANVRPSVQTLGRGNGGGGGGWGGLK